jgi:hypothetical protein
MGIIHVPPTREELERRRWKATYFGSVKQAQRMHQEWISVVRDGRVVERLPASEYRERKRSGTL